MFVAQILTPETMQLTKELIEEFKKAGKVTCREWFKNRKK